MVFYFCFLLSIFFALGFPTAIPKEWISDALPKRDEALSARDLTDFSDQPSTSWISGGGNVKNDPLSDGAQLLSTNKQAPSIPDTDSTLLAQTSSNTDAGLDPITEAVLGGLITGFGALRTGFGAAVVDSWPVECVEIPSEQLDGYRANPRLSKI